MENKRKKIPKNKLKKDHRRETITLDGFFWNKRRIATIDEKMGRCILIIYWKHHRILRRFATFTQLLGILQGLFLSQLLDNNFYVKNGNN